MGKMKGKSLGKVTVLLLLIMYILLIILAMGWVLPMVWAFLIGVWPNLAL